jgi:CubicO group peptidase (beta-lactamase class C family)
MIRQMMAAAITAASASVSLAAGLPRSSPEAQGVSSAGVLAFVDAVDSQIHFLNSFILVRHGHVVAEGWWKPYRAESRHSLYSLSKSFTSTAVGLAIAEGKISLDDHVLKFFPDDAPPHPSENLKAMRVRDLLRMSCGQEVEANQRNDVPWVKTFLAHPVPFKPGTHFLYNNFGAYMLSAIVQKATGQTALDFLKPRLFEPLGIEHPTWGTSPQGISSGASRLSIRTEDIASFGQLYLQHGKWGGKQLLPESWVAAATTLQTGTGSNPKSDWDQGYCYMFWRSRHGAFRGDGMYGQFCIVMPQQDAVLATTSCVKDMQPVLDLVWDHLLPAMKDSPLPENHDAGAKLAARLNELSLPPVRGSAAAAAIYGKEFEFPANPLKLESIRLADDRSGTVTVIARVNGKSYSIPCAGGKWRDCEAAWSDLPPQPSAASGAWNAADTFTFKLSCFETTYFYTTRLEFAGDKLTLTSQANLGDHAAPKTLIGKLKAG